MSNSLQHAHLAQVKSFLTVTVKILNDYLDNHSLAGLLAEQGSKQEEYYKELLKSTRRLQVFCEEALDTVSVLADRESVKRNSIKRTLAGIYRQCIGEFYAPKNEAWYEDRRAAYTGKSAMEFQTSPPASLEKLIHSLEEPFREIREELACYEDEFHIKEMS